MWIPIIELKLSMYLFLWCNSLVVPQNPFILRCGFCRSLTLPCKKIYVMVQNWHLNTKRFIMVFNIPHHLWKWGLTTMKQTILLHLATMLSLKQCQASLATHPDLMQHQPIVSDVHQGVVYGEVNLPKCYALFPCQLGDKSVTISIADKMKCPKEIINMLLLMCYICQLK